MRAADPSPSGTADSPGGGERPHQRISWTVVILVVAAVAMVAVVARIGDVGEREVAASPGASGTVVPTTSASASVEAEPTTESTPPGRDDIPFQPGTATEIIVIVDVSETDDAMAAGIRSGLVDFVQQLPEYDRLTLTAAGEATRTVIESTELDRPGRDAAIEAIGNLAFGGSRQLLRGVEAALAAAHDIGEGHYDALVIATGDDGSTSRDLIEAGRFIEDGRGITLLDLHGIAVGPGEHEAVLARLHETYQWAPTGADVIRALTPYRLVVTEAGLLHIGPVAEQGDPIEVVAGPGLAVRFSVHSPGRSFSIEAESPSGRRYDASSRGENVTAQELGDRVTVLVNGAQEGTWTLGLTGGSEVPHDAWFAVEETVSHYQPLTTAYGTGDTTDDLRFGIALGSAVDPPKASALVMAPDGSERRVELGPMENDELNIGYELTLGAIIDDPDVAGSYTVIIELEDKRGAVRSWMLGAYVAPERDTDGDGIRDSLELQYGLDPTDPSDGAADHDFDGLSTADELTIHGTNAGEWDTDRGQESDGSEVAAGRDPLDPADDVPAVTCLELVPTPDPDASPSPTPAATPDPAPDLEALLPDEVLGYRTEKYSMTAPDRLDFIFGLFDAFLACTDTDRSDLSLAIAIAAGLENWGVVAVEIDGVSGHEMEDIWLFRLAPGGPPRRLVERTVDGREYVEMDAGWATYSTDDTFYWVMNFSFGDGFGEPEASPEPIPEREEIIEAFIRLLPAD